MRFTSVRNILIAISSMFLTTDLMSQNEIDQKINDLLAQMTLEEKIGQMNQYSSFYDATGPAPQGGNAALKYEHLKKGWVGSMLNLRDVSEIRKLQKIAVEESRLGIPMIFGYDVIHGIKTLSPIPLAEAASWDLKAIERSAAIAANEASAVGINWTFAPMVDISRDPRWGRVMEGGGEDPFLGAKIGVARVNGFQGKDLGANTTIAATAKHFAAYGFTEAGKEYNTVDIGTNTLYNMVFPPFKAAVDADVKSVMNSFNILNGIPATADALLQREFLKGTWGFKGFVISDWNSIGEIAPHGFAKNLKHAGEIAVKAGSDMDMEAKAYVTHLAESVREGKVEEKFIDEAVSRILKVKYELGLFDDPYKYCDEQREKDRLYHEEHLEGVLEMAKKSIVLLKNDTGLLPLKKGQKGIVVIGDLADDKNSPLGSWRLASDDNTAVSVLEGIDAYTKDYAFLQGPKVFDDKASFLQHVKINTTDTSGMEAAVNAAKNAEVVILVVGEHGFMSGEARSRTKIDLPGLQHELIKAVMEVNKNVVMVLMNGRPLALPWEAEHVPTILETWHLGSQSGHAIAQTLFGDNNPSGKLPMTFPRSVGQIPIYYNFYNTGRPNQEPNVFWSHYADEEKSPLFHFGHGLSYTNFSYRDLSIDTKDQKNIKVSVTVENSGELAGEEVVQLYLRDPVASIVRPVKELKGFEKIHLQAGASKTVSFEVTPKEMGFYDANYKWVVEPGTFHIMVGGSSAGGLTGTFELK